jgi:hypothetical protein
MNSLMSQPSQPRSRLRYCLLYGVGLILLLAAAGYVLIALIGSRDLRRGPYLQSVTPDSVWVVWDTSQPSVGSVEYGSTPELGQVITEMQAQTHHEVQLTGLEPYSLYTYRVEGSKAAQFRTAAAATQTSFRFVVFGDTREGVGVHHAIVKRILDVAPDFVLYTGDMVEMGGCGSCWDDFFRIEAPLLRSTPFFPTLGNHEDDQSPFAQTYYFDIFHLPGIERWYAFDYGNARFISLKADGYPINVYYPSQEQLDWLESQLATNPNPWTFVFFHWGVFTSRGEDFLELGMRERLVPLFERYGVDAVFMGHNHGYERIVVNGITYITAAGGGASLYDIAYPEPGSQIALRTFNFVRLDMNGETLDGQAIDDHGKVLDRFELTLDK